MKEPKPETPPLTRAGRRIADKKLAEATFTPTSDGKRLSRRYEVHGIAVTESLSATDAPPASRPPTKVPAVDFRVDGTGSKDLRPETPPLTRQGRKLADATLAAATFVPTPDGKRAIRQFEVHGVEVTECVNLEQDAEASKQWE